MKPTVDILIKSNLSNRGSNIVMTLHKPKQLYIYSPLGQTFCISYREKLECLPNSSTFAQINSSKILLVFKHFYVDSFI